MWLWGWSGGDNGAREKPRREFLSKSQEQSPGAQSRRQELGAQKYTSARQGWGPEAEVQSSGP